MAMKDWQPLVCSLMIFILTLIVIYSQLPTARGMDTGIDWGTIRANIIEQQTIPNLERAINDRISRLEAKVTELQRLREKELETVVGLMNDLRKDLLSNDLSSKDKPGDAGMECDDGHDLGLGRVPS
jgi:hypothetical protein